MNHQDPHSRGSGVSPENKHRKGHQGVSKQGPNRHKVHKITELKEERHEGYNEDASKVGKRKMRTHWKYPR